ncbi:MAG: hypothetical protein H6567_09500 [Lewinellaceae bacterium]|nr:hypothetical protein [Lewinellaceae bacterium]
MFKRFLVIALIDIAILAIPFTAMQFSDQVNWSMMDFILMGFMILVLGIVLNIILNSRLTKKMKIFWFVLAMCIFLIVWVELAVGIFDI